MACMPPLDDTAPMLKPCRCVCRAFKNNATRHKRQELGVFLFKARTWLKDGAVNNPLHEFPHNPKIPPDFWRRAQLMVEKGPRLTFAVKASGIKLPPGHRPVGMYPS